MDISSVGERNNPRIGVKQVPIKHRMQWSDSRLIEQIIDGHKTATVRRLAESEGIDEYNTALHVGEVYQVYDANRQPRVAIRLTAVELATWGNLPEELWRRDPAVSGEVSEAAFRADHDGYFGYPSGGFEFLALYFDPFPSADLPK